MNRFPLRKVKVIPMRSSKLIHIVSCHAEGEVGDVIVGGVAPPPGETLWEQSRFIASDVALRDLSSTSRGRRLPPRQSPGAGEGSARPDGLHHHGARGYAADVGLELDLRRDRAPRHRHPADAGARDPLHPRSAGRADRGHRRCRDGKAERVTIETFPPSPTSSMRSSRSRASAP